MSFSVVIPSGSRANLEACVTAIRKYEDADTPIIVVDDTTENLAQDEPYPEWMWPIMRIVGEKPFCFARNSNIGIREAGTDDVVLLNDDALLMTARGFSSLARVAKMNPEYGVIAPSCNNVGNVRQMPQDVGLREEPRMVCFVCVYIPRTTIDQVGFLDERFQGSGGADLGYGMDDDDYCLRVRRAGLKIGIWDHCFVDHKVMPSVYRDILKNGNYQPNLERFKEKWGMDNLGRSA